MKSCKKCKPETTTPATITTTTTVGNCKDESPAKFCRKLNKKKCRKAKIYKKCMKSCKKCEGECEDKRPQKFCNKNRKKCNKKVMKENCMKTCKLC